MTPVQVFPHEQQTYPYRFLGSAVAMVALHDEVPHQTTADQTASGLPGFAAGKGRSS